MASIRNHRAFDERLTPAGLGTPLAARRRPMDERNRDRFRGSAVAPGISVRAGVPSHQFLPLPARAQPTSHEQKDRNRRLPGGAKASGSIFYSATSPWNAQGRQASPTSGNPLVGWGPLCAGGDPSPFLRIGLRMSCLTNQAVTGSIRRSAIRMTVDRFPTGFVPTHQSRGSPHAGGGERSDSE